MLVLFERWRRTKKQTALFPFARGDGVRSGTFDSSTVSARDCSAGTGPSFLAGDWPMYFHWANGTTNERPEIGPLEAGLTRGDK